MTDNEIKTAVAEVDGWSEGKNQCGDDVWICGDIMRFPQRLPKYFESYDAIITVIQKLDSMQFIKFICELLPDEKEFAEIHTMNKARVLYYATPRQMCEALLKACGKWKD